MVKGVLWTGLKKKKKKKSLFSPSVFDFQNVNKPEVRGVKGSFS